MMKAKRNIKGIQSMFAAGVIAAAVGATGCQVDIAGQTLPSPYYMQDDVQYFAPGPEFKLLREAATQKAFKADEEGPAVGP